MVYCLECGDKVKGSYVHCTTCGARLYSDRAKQSQHPSTLPYFVILGVIAISIFMLASSKGFDLEPSAAASLELNEIDCKVEMGRCKAVCPENQIEVCQINCVLAFDECIYYQNQ